MPDAVCDHALFISKVSESSGAALTETAATFSRIAGETEPFLAAAASLISGGKRARARLAHLAWRAAGGQPCHEAIVEAGASLELFQAAALIHDDVIDDAQTRRGAPAAHRTFAAAHRSGDLVGDDAAFGRSAAILLGDLLLALSQLRIARAISLAPHPQNTFEIYGGMCTEVALGQYLDVDAAAHGPNRPGALERAFTVVRHKSARYSVERPLVLGASLAGGGDELVSALSAIGEPLGEAFQLRDDDLGVFGDPNVTGKPAGDDLAEGKLTPLILLGCEMATAEETQFIRQHLGDRAISGESVERIRVILRESGALSRHEQLIAQRREHALDLIAKIQVPAHVRDELADLAVNLTSRTH